eukprot:scaffold1781_cov416-Prasinococcus_capsulatus_cf.AAC.9
MPPGALQSTLKKFPEGHFTSDVTGNGGLRILFLGDVIDLHAAGRPGCWASGPLLLERPRSPSHDTLAERQRHR